MAALNSPFAGPSPFASGVAALTQNQMQGGYEQMQRDAMSAYVPANLSGEKMGGLLPMLMGDQQLQVSADQQGMDIVSFFKQLHPQAQQQHIERVSGRHAAALTARDAFNNEIATPQHPSDKVTDGHPPAIDPNSAEYHNMRMDGQNTRSYHRRRQQQFYYYYY